MKKIAPAVIAVITALFFQACTNKDVSSPSSSLSASQQFKEDAVSATTLKNPAAGDYTVKLFIDEGDTNTVEFKKYVFTFKSNGVLLAKVNSTTYTGKWESKDNGTELKLDIRGTRALDDIDKGWDVIKITATQISLKDNDEGSNEKLTLVKIN